MSPLLDPLNIMLLVAAVFLLWKLKSVLGQRTGMEKPPSVIRSTPAERSQVVDVAANDTISKAEGTSHEPPWKGVAEPGSPVAKGLDAILRASRNFEISEFMNGATLAYEMIHEAFAKGSRQSLKPLLSKEVFDSFAGAIDHREKSGQSMVLQFVGVRSAKIEAARLDGRSAQIAVKFVGEMISAVVDRDGKPVEGDPKQVRDIVDLWTFEKDVTSRDPNWKLSDTSGDNV